MPTSGEIRSFLARKSMGESERAIRLEVKQLAIEIMTSVDPSLTEVQDAFQAVRERLRSSAEDFRALLLAEALWPYWSYWQIKPQLDDSAFDSVLAQCATCNACWMTGDGDRVGGRCSACETVYCRVCQSDRRCPRCRIGLSSEYRPNGRTHRPFKYFSDEALPEDQPPPGATQRVATGRVGDWVSEPRKVTPTWPSFGAGILEAERRAKAAKPERRTPVDGAEPEKLGGDPEAIVCRQCNRRDVVKMDNGRYWCRLCGDWATGMSQPTAAELKGAREGTMQPLFTALNDESSIVRRTETPGEIEVERLIASLHDADYQVRYDAASKLGRSADPRAVKPLITALTDRDSLVRSFAATALGNIGDARAVEPLKHALLDESEMVQHSAAAALSTLGSTPEDSRFALLAVRYYDWDLATKYGAPAVRPLLEATRLPGKSSSVTKAIREIGPAAVQPLVEALADERAGVTRFAAATILGQIGDPHAFEFLEAVLDGQDVELRRKAAEALGKIGDAHGVEPLVGALQDGDATVRLRTAEALGRIGDDRALTPLMAALRDKDPSVQLKAAAALQRKWSVEAKDALEDYRRGVEEAKTKRGGERQRPADEL